MANEEQSGRQPGDELEIEGFPVLRHDVGGVDLGSTEHWVCAPRLDGKGREVDKFGATTPELERLCEWLKARSVRSVALESTGVYWIAPHEVMERYGLEVLLVNTRELARVPGRQKTDRIGERCGGAQALPPRSQTVCLAAIASGNHPIPFRTRK